jgi:hypothetical protein
MALISSVRGPSSPPTSTDKLPRLDFAAAVVWSVFLTALVVGPWLAPGYLFGTDWPGPRRFDFPNYPYNWAPVEAALALVSRISSPETAGKLFVVAVLLVGALTAFRAAPAAGFVPRAMASTVYVLNPFVYGRLHYGQFLVLAGYALLPWVAVSYRRVLLEPNLKSSLTLAASLLLLGVVSTHMFAVAVVLGVALVVAHVVAAGKRVEYLKRSVPSLLIAAALALVASAYWLVPLILGRGPEATVIAGTSTADLNAYAAVPDPQLGLLPNLLGLYGFWAENAGRFASMKGFAPFWPAILATLITVAAVGAVSAIKHGRERLRPWVAGLLLAAAVALVLEMGVSHAVTSGFVSWLDANFPLYRGMRDAGKWAALLALVYSQLTALGAAAILGRIRSRPLDGDRSEWVGSLAAGLLLAVPLYYGNGLLFGMHGEIKPSSYPAGWYQADQILAADSHPGRALILPWHEYMSYSFIQNQNKVVAPPALTFFSIPVLVSTDPEVAGVGPPTDPDQVAIRTLIGDGGQGHWAEVLAALKIKYVLVAREVDWASFRYLDDQAGIVKVGDFGSIVLYSVSGINTT